MPSTLKKVEGELLSKMMSRLPGGILFFRVIALCNAAAYLGIEDISKTIIASSFNLVS